MSKLVSSIILYRLRELVFIIAVFEINVVIAEDSSFMGSLVPVGAIIAWHQTEDSQKLGEQWKECNGQKVEDPDSIFDGMNLPELNESKRFLRGGNKSEEYQEQDWKSFEVDNFSTDNNTYSHDPVKINKEDWTRNSKETNIFSGEWAGEPAATVLDFKFDDSEVRPKNMSVIWIIRIK